MFPYLDIKPVSLRRCYSEMCATSTVSPSPSRESEGGSREWEEKTRTFSDTSYVPGSGNLPFH